MTDYYLTGAQADQVAALEDAGMSFQDAMKAVVEGAVDLSATTSKIELAANPQVAPVPASNIRPSRASIGAVAYTAPPPPVPNKPVGPLRPFLDLAWSHVQHRRITPPGDRAITLGGVRLATGVLGVPYLLYRRADGQPGYVAEPCAYEVAQIVGRIER